MKIVNYTDENLDFIKEHCKDYDTSNLTIKIKNSKGNQMGRFYTSNPFAVGSLIVVRTGKKLSYPHEVKLYKRRNLPDSIIVNSRQELIRYMFFHEFMHFIQARTSKIYSEGEAEHYAIANFRSDKK